MNLLAASGKLELQRAVSRVREMPIEDSQIVKMLREICETLQPRGREEVPSVSEQSTIGSSATGARGQVSSSLAPLHLEDVGGALPLGNPSMHPIQGESAESRTLEPWLVDNPSWPRGIWTYPYNQERDVYEIRDGEGQWIGEISPTMVAFALVRTNNFYRGIPEPPSDCCENWRSRAKKAEQLLAEAAHEINCSGPVAHRIRVMRQEWSAELERANAANTDLLLQISELQRQQTNLACMSIQSLISAGNQNVPDLQARAEKAEADNTGMRSEITTLSVRLADFYKP